MFGGLDVGRRHDRSALVRLEGKSRNYLQVRDVRLGSGPLPVQARILVPLLRPCLLTAVDATGLGLGLAETLAEAGLPVLLVTIVAGWEVVSLEPDRVTAGKAWLMGRVSAALVRAPTPLRSERRRGGNVAFRIVNGYSQMEAHRACPVRSVGWPRRYRFGPSPRPPGG
jgi:hypothetical protein